jgi:hypothetical protein
MPHMTSVTGVLSKQTCRHHMHVILVLTRTSLRDVVLAADDIHNYSPGCSETYIRSMQIV